MATKWTLTIEEEGGKTHPVQLVRDVYTIGRDPSNDIALRERNISRRHARLERAGPDRWVLVDEDSRYGCFINGERIKGRSFISPVDSAQIGGYHFTVLSSWGKRGGVAPALSVTRSLLVPIEVPPKLRLFDGLSPVADVRLDRGPVTFGTDQDCTVRLLGMENALVHIRPLPGGSFELVDRGDIVLVRLKGQELRRKILDNADLFDLGDNLAIRFLQGGRHARADDPDFSPSPLVDLSNGVAEAKVLGVDGVPILRQGLSNGPAASTLMGLQAPKPPPLPPANSTATTPADPIPWHSNRREGPRPNMATERMQMPRLATERLIVTPPLPPPLPADEAWASASQPPPIASDDAWAAAPPPEDGWAPSPMAPQAEMSWPPMGVHAPSSIPGPGPDAWIAAQPPHAPGFGMTQPLHYAQHATNRPGMKRSLLALVVLVPLSLGALVTLLLVVGIRPSPPATNDDLPAASTTATNETPPPSASSDVPPADSAAPSASAAPSGSAEDPAGQADRAPRTPPGGKWRKPSNNGPGGAAAAEAERQRQARCQQRGQCNLRPPPLARSPSPPAKAPADGGAVRARRKAPRARQRSGLDFGASLALEGGPPSRHGAAVVARVCRNVTLRLGSRSNEAPQGLGSSFARRHSPPSRARADRRRAPRLVQPRTRAGVGIGVVVDRMAEAKAAVGSDLHSSSTCRRIVELGQPSAVRTAGVVDRARCSVVPRRLVAPSVKNRLRPDEAASSTTGALAFESPRPPGPFPLIGLSVPALTDVRSPQRTRRRAQSTSDRGVVGMLER
jgi:FHA domain-containing protein